MAKAWGAGRRRRGGALRGAAETAPKPKLGRPPLGDKARTHVLTLKVSAVERRSWQLAAAPLTLSDWIRGLCNGEVGR
jgi:hypothetical protein